MCSKITTGNRWLRHLCAAIAFCLCVAAAAQERLAARPDNAGEFHLVRDGKPACVIVTAVSPTPAARLAALELQTHIMKMTGVEIPLQNEAEVDEGGARILVGDTAGTRALGILQEDFADQEYLIAFRENNLIITGLDWIDTPENRNAPGRQTLGQFRARIDYWQTAGVPDREPLEIELPGLYDNHGTSHAAYHFLDYYCGVRWYGPTEIHVITPRHDNLSVKREDVRRAPALKHRNALSSGMWPIMRGQWGGFYQSRPNLELFWRRLRLGGEPWMANHTITQRSIPAAMNDPEIQAHGQARGFGLCFTHPKAVELIAGFARHYFDGGTDLPVDTYAVGDYFAVVPEDVWYFCNCESCQALLDKGSSDGDGLFASSRASEYWFSFVNAVAREVGKTHPDKWIATLAYWNYSHPPKTFPMEPNVSVAPCLHICEYPMNMAVRENDRKLYQAWQAATDAPMFMWNYYHLPMEAGLIQGWKCFPHIMIRQTAGVARRFANEGVRGIFICGEQDQLEYYVMVRLWDDPSLDTGTMVDEFFNLYFGAAAEPMKRFYETIEEIVCNPDNYPAGAVMQNADIAWSHLGTSERMRRLGALMKSAETRAATDAEKARVSFWRQGIWQWMLDGRAEYEARHR